MKPEDVLNCFIELVNTVSSKIQNYIPSTQTPSAFRRLFFPREESALPTESPEQRYLKELKMLTDDLQKGLQQKIAAVDRLMPIQINVMGSELCELYVNYLEALNGVSSLYELHGITNRILNMHISEYFERVLGAETIQTMYSPGVVPPSPRAMVDCYLAALFNHKKAYEREVSREIQQTQKIEQSSFFTRHTPSPPQGHNPGQMVPITPLGRGDEFEGDCASSMSL